MAYHNPNATRQDKNYHILMGSNRQAQVIKPWRGIPTGSLVDFVGDNITTEAPRVTFNGKEYTVPWSHLGTVPKDRVAYLHARLNNIEAYLQSRFP
jgi:hypothetical protein